MIQKIFRSFLSFMMGNRQTGHTTLLQKIADEHDVYIIVDSMQSKDEFPKHLQDKCIPLGRIDKLDGAPNKPILIDNGALQTMLREMLLECGRLEEENTIKDHHVEQIELVLSYYRQRFPKKGVGFKHTVAQSAIRMSEDYLNLNRD
jgi:hypothetical protein